LSLNIPELNISAFNKILIKFNESPAVKCQYPTGK
jgi:hypothetical protein